MTAVTQPGAVAPNRLMHRGSAGNKTMMIIGTVLLLLANLVILFVVPAFRPMLEAFGVDLPNLTRWVVAYYPGLLLFVFVPPALWAVWPNPARSGLAALIAGIVLGSALVALTVFALYLPIFHIAGKVS